MPYLIQGSHLSPEQRYTQNRAEEAQHLTPSAFAEEQPRVLGA
jgi:hypothetical protein